MPPNPLPADPFRLADTVPVCDRVRLLEALAATLPESARTGEWHRRLLALEGLRAVQSLEYVPNTAREEWLQSVGRTLRTRRGECKALSTTLVALYRALGLRPRVVWVDQPGAPLNHVTAKVWIDGGWLWAEPSVRGAMLGESPYDALARAGDDAWEVVGGAPANGSGGAAAAAGQAQGQAETQGRRGRDDDEGDGRRRRRRPRERVEVVVRWPWSGWNTLWGGWPWWWFARNYPYLAAPYASLAAYPTYYGFYPQPAYAQPVYPYGYTYNYPAYATPVAYRG